MDSLILEDRYGKHYRLRLPGDVFFPHVSIDHKKFHDRPPALCFIQGLRYDAFRWRYVLNSVTGQRQCLRDNEILDAIATQIERGRIKVYPISHLTRSASPVQYPVGEARGSIRYRFIPASMLLTNSPHDVRIFHSKDDAERFVQSLQWDDVSSEAIPKTPPRPTADSSNRARREKTDDLIDKMAKGEIVVAKEIVSATPPEPTAVETSASGPGNRAGTLGPHVDSENTVSKQNIFKTQHEAVTEVSNKINPVSTVENIEYGGMIYKNGDGTYSYTEPVKGAIGGVNPGGPNSVPPGTTASAYYHTHGAHDPEYDSENFSGADGDIGYADYYKIDGYVATPSGRLKHYDHKTYKIQTIGKVKN